MTSLSECVFEWDEPEGCTTPRGWVHLANHPESPDAGNCVGNYLEYTPGICTTRGPNGETVHAVAYVNRASGIAPRHHALGYSWFFTIDAAKAFIEGNVRAYFGLPREPIAPLFAS